MSRLSVARYLMKFALPGTMFELVPLLDDEAASRARRYKTIRSLTLGVALPTLTAADFEAGVGAIRAVGDHFGAGFANITVDASLDRGNSLLLDRLWSTVDFLLGGSDSDSNLELTIDGREFDEDSFKVIDLIQHCEQRTRQLQVDNVERNVPYADRWKALTEVRREFLS